MSELLAMARIEVEACDDRPDAVRLCVDGDHGPTTLMLKPLGARVLVRALNEALREIANRDTAVHCVWDGETP